MSFCIAGVIRSFCIAVVAALVVVAGPVAPAVAQSGGGKLVIVLDSSGSMAGKIGGVAKIDIARNVVADLLTTISPDTQLGFVAYGHRRKGDCRDIQTIYDVGRPDKAAITAAMSRLQPIGKTPLGDAVRQAAQMVNFTEEKASVILVSDGKENCGVDICALGSELKRQGIDFVVHVVGFNVKREEEAGLVCLARNTGGQYVQASDAGTLAKALHKTVKAAKALVPEAPPQPAGPVGLKVDVLVGEGGPKWEGDIAINILSPKAGLDGKRKKIADFWRVKSGHIVKNLAAGDYVLQVVLPDQRYVVREYPISVKAGAAQIATVILNVGQVRFDASLQEGGKPFDWDLGWSVYEPQTDLAGKRRKLTDFWRVKTGTVFWLPAGKWRIEGVVADARYMHVVKEITVEPGSGVAHSFNFNGGLVRFDAGLDEEGATIGDDLGWTLYSPEVDLAGKRKKLTDFWRVKSGSIFVLPAGKWVVAGVLPDARHVTLQGAITVEPGSERLHRFSFNAGRVRFDATVNGQPATGDVAFTVFARQRDLAGKRRKIADFWRVKSGMTTLIKAGEYALTGLLPDDRATTGEVEFAVTAGGEVAVKVDLKRK